MKLLTEIETNDIWNKVYVKFHFSPNMQTIPFQISEEYKVFSLQSYWGTEQNNIVNQILCDSSCDSLYALDWQHDCFTFSPKENIPLGISWHDDRRNCTVYFPEYYPDGDYHFFIATDFSYGMMGHPWRKEIWVFGHHFIAQIKKSSAALCLAEKNL